MKEKRPTPKSTLKSTMLDYSEKRFQETGSLPDLRLFKNLGTGAWRTSSRSLNDEDALWVMVARVGVDGAVTYASKSS